MLKYVVLATTALGLTACGSTYVPPQEPAPAIWQGKSGVKITGDTYELFPGTLKKGQIFAQTEVSNIRTGRLVEPVTYTSGAAVTTVNKSLTLPAGTPLYARQFTQKTTRYVNYKPTSTTVQRSDRNPIEWCAERPNGEGSVCIFWQDPETAFYLEERNGSPISPALTRTVGAKGPMPEIAEDADVEFSSELKLALKVADITKKHILIQHLIGSKVEDDFKGSRINYQRKMWSPDGTAVLKMAGGEFNLTAVRDEPDGKPVAVKIEVVKPPKVTKRGQLTEAEKAQLMELMLKAMGQEKAKE